MNNQVIKYGVGFFDGKSLKDVTHNVTSLNIDNRNQTIQITIENRTAIVEGITITMEEAEEIGFINFDVLEKYCK